MGEVHDLDHVALAEADRLLDDLAAGRAPRGSGEDPVVSALSAWACDIDADPSLTPRAGWHEASRVAAPVATKVAADRPVARVRGRALGGAVLALATFTGGSVAAAITGADVPMFRAVGSALVSGFSGTFPVIDLAPPIRPDLGTGQADLAGQAPVGGGVDPGGVPAGAASSSAVQVELDLMRILDAAIEDGARVGGQIDIPAVTAVPPEAGAGNDGPRSAADLVEGGGTDLADAGTPPPASIDPSPRPTEQASDLRPEREQARAPQAATPVAPTPIVQPSRPAGDDRPRPSADAVPRRGPAPEALAPTTGSPPTGSQATPDEGAQALTGGQGTEPARPRPVAGPHDGVPPGHRGGEQDDQLRRGGSAAPGRSEQPSARPAPGRSTPAPVSQPGDAQNGDAQGEDVQGGDVQQPADDQTTQGAQGGQESGQVTDAPGSSGVDEQGQDQQSGPGQQDEQE